LWLVSGVTYRESLPRSHRELQLSDAMKWTTKAFIQRTLAQLPTGRQIYALGQRSVGGLRGFTIKSKVDQGWRLFEPLLKTGFDVSGLTAVEVGTGWAPVVPLLFWLFGQNSCHTYDITRLLDAKLVVKTAAQLVALHGEPAQAQAAWRAAVQSERLRQLRELTAAQADAAEILQTCAITYHAPADASVTNWPDDSVDQVYANTVLEHVPTEKIKSVFREAQRILRPGGVMFHLIDPSDHFAHKDGSISGVNFLQFSEHDFARYNTCFLYQNRLRAPTYRKLVEEAGFEIVHWEVRLDQRALRSLPDLKVHPNFAVFSNEELCSMSVRVVARKPWKRPPGPRVP
jgi:SAM-dependent methyltransferase